MGRHVGTGDPARHPRHRDPGRRWDATQRRGVTCRAGGVLAALGGWWLGVGPFILQTESVSQFFRRGIYHWMTGIAVLVLASYVVGRLSATRADRDIDLTDRTATPPVAREEARS